MEQSILEIKKSLEMHPDLNIRENEPMSRHTTFKIGGPAELFIEAKTVQAMVYALQCSYEKGYRPFVFGNGSNLLVADKGIPGIVLKISGGECLLDGQFLMVDSGVTLTAAARFALSHGMSGLEFMYGIPGTIGGAVVMNAGAYGREISDVLVETTYLSIEGNVLRIGHDAHLFGYRDSFFKRNPDNIVLSTKLMLISGEPLAIESRMNELLARRKLKQPLEFPSAGSVFKRPVGYFAGALIEQCNLKGYCIGGAQVSPKHAGFIVNTGNATCEDVLRLIEHIKNTVLKETGVDLECEVLCAPRHD